jgi:hypothetical protein
MADLALFEGCFASRDALRKCRARPSAEDDNANRQISDQHVLFSDVKPLS